MSEKTPSEEHAALKERLAEAEQALAVARTAYHEVPGNLHGAEEVRSAMAEVEDLHRRLEEHRHDHPDL